MLVFCQTVVPQVYTAKRCLQVVSCRLMGLPGGYRDLRKFIHMDNRTQSCRKRGGCHQPHGNSPPVFIVRRRCVSSAGVCRRATSLVAVFCIYNMLFRIASYTAPLASKASKPRQADHVSPRQNYVSGLQPVVFMYAYRSASERCACNCFHLWCTLCFLRTYSYSVPH